MKTGIELITEERTRQYSQKGWSAAHDDEHMQGELAMAACCYAAPKNILIADKRANAVIYCDPWPWDQRYDKRYIAKYGNVIPPPDYYNYQTRLRFLVKAGALIAAEIDRLKRTIK